MVNFGRQPIRLSFGFLAEALPTMANKAALRNCIRNMLEQMRNISKGCSHSNQLDSDSVIIQIDIGLTFFRLLLFRFNKCYNRLIDFFLSFKT